MNFLTLRLSIQAPDLAGKRLELLRESFPDVRRLAIIGNVQYAATVLEMGEAQAPADDADRPRRSDNRD